MLSILGKKYQKVMKDGCSYTQDNEADCWGNEPSCADCLWYREMIICR